MRIPAPLQTAEQCPQPEAETLCYREHNTVYMASNALKILNFFMKPKYRMLPRLQNKRGRAWDSGGPAFHPWWVCFLPWCSSPLQVSLLSCSGPPNRRHDSSLFPSFYLEVIIHISDQTHKERLSWPFQAQIKHISGKDSLVSFSLPLIHCSWCLATLYCGSSHCHRGGIQVTLDWRVLCEPCHWHHVVSGQWSNE